MEYRFLGRSGLQVSAISLGGWLTYGGHVDEDGTYACLKAAYDAGINFFDCAEGYQDGESERVMGGAIKKFGWKRNDIVVSTKIYWGAAHGTNPVNNTGLSRKHIIEGLASSLIRLQLPYVDLVYAHRPDRHTPIEETVRAFNHLITTGQALYWGTSEWRADEIARAHGVAERLGLIAPLMEQPQYNMLVRQRVESEYELLIKEHGMGITSFSPLKAGALTGKYLDGIPADSRLGASKDKWAKGVREGEGSEKWVKEMDVVRKLGPVAEKLGTDRAGLALAWVLKNDAISSAITGASRPEQVWRSVRALEVVGKLTEEVVEEIEGILGNKPEAIVMRF
ncbi:voltage-gated potassium channel subunit beta-2 [Lophium mytilinum]|uniref:Voltage-gated potassium channel subunit beta-2 n=1 Tax=Lophium mytilinum TaxID=390894 RepID=A0A6A6QLX7_9PEZI|nr:voltage-gated potassium channel subunit beta-2 [Lophium mytilinum]